MGDAGLVRALSLFLPIAVAGGLCLVRRPNRRQATALGLAAAWNFATLLPLNVLATRLGWWRFEAQGGSIAGVPVDLLLGWVLMWGPVAALALDRVPLFFAAGIALWIDVLFMPLAAPVVHLGHGWLVGDGVAVFIAFVPGQLLARWTAKGQHLPRRVALQAIGYSALFLWGLPTVIVDITGGSWQPLLTRPVASLAVFVQLLALPAILGLSAAQEFAQRGGGTPLPYDPPQRLVASGVYAYVANPMQLATSTLLVGLGWVLQSGWVAAAGVMAVVYGAGLAGWHEDAQLTERFGARWRRYRQAVHTWLPRWRPWPGAPARLYVARGCGACERVGRWIQERHPVALTLVPAQQHPARDLTRLTYAPGDGGPEESGVAALARALEHVHLGWAVIGWTVRLPGLLPCIQLLTDAVGGGPRLVPRDAPDSGVRGARLAPHGAGAVTTPVPFAEKRIEL